MSSPAMQGPLPPDENQGPGILAVSWLECGIAFIFVALRMYCRGFLLRNIGRDDWTMVLAFVLAVITTVFVTLEVHFGVGRHIMYLQPNDVTAAVKFIWMTQPFSTFSACFGKISIAFLLMRLMNKHNKLQVATLWFIIVTLFLINLACTIVTFAQCSPVWELWQGPHPNPNCIDPHIQQNVGYAQAAYSSFTDLVLAIFPYFIIWGLQIELRIKLGLLFLLSLGVFATAASIVKTVELENLTSSDFTWDASSLAYWFMTENYVIIIAACIPTLRPLFKDSSVSQAVSKGRWTGKGYVPYGSAKSSNPRSNITGTHLDEVPLKGQASVDTVSHNDEHV